MRTGKDTFIGIGIAQLALIILLFGSCTKDSGPIVVRPPVDTLSFQDTILPIFLTHCPDCHPGYADMDLGVINSYTDLVGVTSTNYAPFKRVVPFDPENSVLYLKVSGDSHFGNRMPMYADPLTEDEVWLIYDWIAQGAMNN